MCNPRIGPLHDSVIWKGINYAGTQITQWAFQTKGTLTSPGRLSFVLKVPSRYILSKHNLFFTMWPNRAKDLVSGGWRDFHEDLYLYGVRGFKSSGSVLESRWSPETNTRKRQFDISWSNCNSTSELWALNKTLLYWQLPAFSQTYGTLTEYFELDYFVWISFSR